MIPLNHINSSVIVKKDYKGEMTYGCYAEKKQQGGLFRGSWYQKYMKVDLEKLQLVYAPSPAEERGTKYIRLCDITFAKIDTVKTKYDRRVLVIGQRTEHKMFRFFKNEELDKFTKLLSNVIKIVYELPIFNPGSPEGVNLTF